MSKGKKKSSNAALVATIIVALAAIAAIVILLVMMSGRNTEEPSSDTGFHASQELFDECLYSAHDLVGNNYKIIKLYITEGLPHEDEPYGNEPEDGIYTVASEEYTSLSQIEELVKSVYTEEIADTILHKMEVTTQSGSKESLEVYKNRDVFGETFLGIDAKFKPDEGYTKDWSSCFLEVVPKSETECDLTVYIDGIKPEEAAAHPESVITTHMTKLEGGWRLTEILK